MAISKKELLEKVNPITYMENFLGIEVITKGNDIRAISPFAPDNNPSLSIKELDGRWLITDWRFPPEERNKNIIDVTMAVTSLDFYDAMVKINKDLNLGLDKNDKDMESFGKELKRTFDMNHEAQNYYKKTLMSSEEGLSYMKKRGYTKEDCEKYELGYIPNFDKNFIPYYGK